MVDSSLAEFVVIPCPACRRGMTWDPALGLFRCDQCDAGATVLLTANGRNCPQCGLFFRFEARREDATYCSAKCREKAYRERRKGR